MALYDLIRSLAPAWVSRKPRAHWGVFLDVLALSVDALAELSDQARASALPGQYDGAGVVNLGGYWGVDALDLLGRDRMVVRGLAEAPAHYAARLRRYRALYPAEKATRL